MSPRMGSWALRARFCSVRSTYTDRKQNCQTDRVAPGRELKPAADRERQTYQDRSEGQQQKQCEDPKHWCRGLLTPRPRSLQSRSETPELPTMTRKSMCWSADWSGTHLGAS